MRLSEAVCAALLASAALSGAARAEGKAPVLLVQPGPESGKPFVFQLKGAAGEVLCTSDGYKSAKLAGKFAKRSIGFGKDMKHYIFQKSADAKGEHHFWEIRDSKARQFSYCRSGPVDDRAQAEHSASVASKAFAQATVVVK
jgi:hypothetical protein